MADKALNQYFLVSPWCHQVLTIRMLPHPMHILFLLWLKPLSVNLRKQVEQQTNFKVHQSFSVLA